MKNTFAFIRDGRWLTMTIAVIVSVFVLAAMAQASSTISTNIQTDGTLTVALGSSLQGATSTSLAVTGSSTITTTLDVGGTLKANGGLIVGPNGTNGTISAAVFGTCNITQVALAATTSAGFACTTATGITTSFKVFVSATSTLVSGAVANAYGGFSIQAASSTANDTIGVQIVNLVGVSATPAGTLNFWAVR